MSKLTTRLADLIAADNAILFVGSALRSGDRTSHDPPAIEQIAEALAARIEYQRPDRSLSAIARDYEVLKGRNALINALREETHKLELEPKPDPLHQLIADAVLPHTKVLTTRFDQILERALDQFQKPYVLIVRDADVPFFDEAKITLIKMQGDIDQPDSLIITEDDLDDFIRRLPTISDVVRAFFATKTLIFLGYDLNSPLFKRFYNQVTRNLSAFRRQAYAVVPEPLDPVEDKYWAAQNVETIEENPLQFLEDLAAAVKAEVLVPRDPEPTDRLLELQTGRLPTRPYRALRSFTTADAAIFSGRDEESHRLANRILAHRLTLLYGESGSGKSSLIHAGVTPRLFRQRSLVAACTPTPDQPLTEILRRALIETGERVGLTSPSESLLVTIREWQRGLSGPIVLVLDQFEQFFLVYNPQERTAAARLFHELHEDLSLNLRLVFILREDFLGRLQTLEGLVPGLMDVRFRLQKLGRENARAALEEPARLFNARWEPALVQTLLDELITDDGDISPPQLQLVADQLWQDAVAERRFGSTPMEDIGRSTGAGQTDSERRSNSPNDSEGVSRPTDDRAVFLTLERFTALGGVPAILGNYLDQTLAAFPEPDQPLVRTLLGTLVSSGGVKQRLRLEDIARAADLDPEKASALLDHLTSLRLLQRHVEAKHPASSPYLPDASPQPEYELTHDYLVPRITRWLGQDFWDAQKAREIIRQDFSAWQTRSRLIALDDLKILNAQHTNIRLAYGEAKMVFASAVAYDDGVLLWEPGLSTADRQRELLNLLLHPDDSARARAATYLAAHPNQMVALTLSDCAVKDSASLVRESAANSLAILIDDAPKTITQPAVDVLLAARDDPRQNLLSTNALVAIRDAQPGVDALLPKDVRGQITRKVWRVRFQRHRGEMVEMILKGLQGGFIGLGLGMGVFFGLGSAQDLSILPFIRIFGLIYFGIAVAGVLGATAGAMTAGNQAAFQYILDGDRPVARWLSGTTLSAVVMAVSFLFLSGIFAGETRVTAALGAGALIGAGLTAPAIAPFRFSWAARLGASAASGIVVFLLANQLLFDQAMVWTVLMGLSGGIGFFLAFNWNK